MGLLCRYCSIGDMPANWLNHPKAVWNGDGRDIAFICAIIYATIEIIWRVSIMTV